MEKCKVCGSDRIISISSEASEFHTIQFARYKCDECGSVFEEKER